VSPFGTALARGLSYRWGRLTKIVAPSQEPAYKTQPEYCLLVFARSEDSRLAGPRRHSFVDAIAMAI